MVRRVELACLAIAIRRRALRVPVLAAYIVTAGAVGLYLGLTTLRDRVVDERVAVGTPAAAGVFRSGEHHTEAARQSCT